MSTSTNEHRGRGRPKGSKNITQEIDLAVSRCPKCGSTQRSEYVNRTEQAYDGLHNDQPYTHIIRRRTQCQGCGQHRIDRSFENRVSTDMQE